MKQRMIVLLLGLLMILLPAPAAFATQDPTSQESQGPREDDDRGWGVTLPPGVPGQPPPGGSSSASPPASKSPDIPDARPSTAPPSALGSRSGAPSSGEDGARGGSESVAGDSSSRPAGPPAHGPVPAWTNGTVGNFDLYGDYDYGDDDVGSRDEEEQGARAWGAPTELLPVLPLGAGLAFLGLGLAFLGLRLRR